MLLPEDYGSAVELRPKPLSYNVEFSFERIVTLSEGERGHDFYYNVEIGGLPLPVDQEWLQKSAIAFAELLSDATGWKIIPMDLNVSYNHSAPISEIW
jgi:hypothetical protein